MSLEENLCRHVLWKDMVLTSASWADAARPLRSHVGPPGSSPANMRATMRLRPLTPALEGAGASLRLGL